VIRTPRPRLVPLALALLASSLGACTTAPRIACTTDNQCTIPQVCMDGVCGEPPDAFMLPMDAAVLPGGG
jgi:hypothetical protein